MLGLICKTIFHYIIAGYNVTGKHIATNNPNYVNIHTTPLRDVQTTDTSNQVSADMYIFIEFKLHLLCTVHRVSYNLKWCN